MAVVEDNIYQGSINDQSDQFNGDLNGDQNNSQDGGESMHENGDFNGNGGGNEDGNQNGDVNTIDDNSQNNEDTNGQNNGGNRGNSMEPEQFRKVFIGGLSYKTDDDTLKNYFSKYGELVDFVVMKDGQSGRSRGFGFVTYSCSSMVDELMKNRPHIIDGRQVEPKRATPREDSGKTEVQMTVKKLFIGGLRDNITEDDLKTYFSNYGNIAEAIVMKEKDSSKSRGFGFVTFDDYDPVDKIILEKHHTINGVNVHTQKALPKDYERDGGNRNNNNRGGNQSGGFNNGGNFRNNNNNFGNNFGNNNGGGNFGNFGNGGGFQMGNNRNFQNGNRNNNNNNRMGGGGGGGGGPMKGGRFNNNRSGPYQRGGFNNGGGNNNNFNNNRGNRTGGRGVGQRGGGGGGGNQNNNNSQ